MLIDYDTIAKLATMPKPKAKEPKEPLVSYAQAIESGLSRADLNKMTKVRIEKNGQTEIKYPASEINRRIAINEELARLKTENIYLYYDKLRAEKKQEKKAKDKEATKQAKSILRKFALADDEPLDFTVRLGPLNPKSS